MELYSFYYSTGVAPPPPTDGWNLSTLSYDSVSFDGTAQNGNITGFDIKPDGTKLYLCGNASSRNIFQYTMSTAGNVGTASYDSVSFSVESQVSSIRGFVFSSDGTKMYAWNTTDQIFQYSLSTAWDVSTASYDSKSFTATSQENNAFGFVFKPDGTKMYVIGVAADRVFQYSLSTAWDVSTASYDSVSFYVIFQEGSSRSIVFKPDGTKMYVIGGNADSVFQYTLSTPWDVSTASYDSVSFSVDSQETTPTQLLFNANGTKMYVLGTVSRLVFQYSLTD